MANLDPLIPCLREAEEAAGLLHRMLAGSASVDAVPVQDAGSTR